MPSDLPAVLVISLANDSPRRRVIGDRLKQLGISFRFFDAIDGRSGLDAAAEARIDRSARLPNDRVMTDPEYACALSHRAAYQHILDTGMSGAVILEDDAIPRPALKRFIDASGHLKSDLVLLDHGQAVPLPFDLWRISGVGVGMRVMNIPNYATGYSVTRRGGERLLKAATPVRRVADWPMNLRHMQAHALYPRCVGRPLPGTTRSWIETQRAEAFSKARAAREDSGRARD